MNPIRTLVLGLALFFAATASAGVRSAVNKWWFERLTGGSCQKQGIPPAQQRDLLRHRDQIEGMLCHAGYCENEKESPFQAFISDAKDMRETVFWSLLAKEQESQADCALEYWRRLDSRVFQADKEVGSRVTEAHQEIVRDMMEKGSEYIRTKDKAIQSQILLSLFDGEDGRVQEYFLKTIVPALEKQGTEGSTVQEDQFLRGKESFQAKVVEANVRRAQSDFHLYGEYVKKREFPHEYKTSTLRSGLAWGMMYGQPEGRANPFADLTCQIEGKFGVGSDLSFYANSIIMGVVTLGTIGSAYALPALVESGAITASTAKAAAILLATANLSMTAYDFLDAYQNECRDTRPVSIRRGYCAKVDRGEPDIRATVESDLSEKRCFLSVALGALSGAAGLRELRAIKAIRVGSHISVVRPAGSTAGAWVRSLAETEFGLRVPASRWSKITEALDSPETEAVLGRVLSRLNKSSSAVKGQFVDELLRSLEVQQGGRALRLMEKLLEQGDPEDAIRMLREIRLTKGVDWTSRLRTWIERLDVDEALRGKVLSCLTS